MQEDEDLALDIKGAREVIKWFGRWPSFHDAEIVGLHLNRNGESILRIYAFMMGPEIEESGHYRLHNKALVSFYLTDLVDLELADFSIQNVISGLVLKKDPEGFRLELGCCYGLCGFLQCKVDRVEIEPYEALLTAAI